jgi:hypothetical protein
MNIDVWKKRGPYLSLILLAWLTVLSCASAQSSNIIVTTISDDGPRSLRQAIADAAPGAVITLAVRGTIVLTNGELVISNDLNIVGLGKDLLTISGNHTNRIFNISSGATVVISGLTMASGRAPDGGRDDGYPPTPMPGGSGGAVLNAGWLTLSNCAIVGSVAGKGGYTSTHNGYRTPYAGGNGGGVYNANYLYATGCSFETNSAGEGANGYTEYNGPGGSFSRGGNGGSGGGIHNEGVMSLINCTFTGNRSGNGESGGWGSGLGCWPNPFCGARGGEAGNGGAIFNSGTSTLAHCNLSSNSAGISGDGSSIGQGGCGGGIYNQGTVRLADCTLDHNVAGPGIASKLTLPADGGSGGAIYNALNLQATACAFSGNSAGAGGTGVTIPNDPYGRVVPGHAGNGGLGGALANDGTASFTNCTFFANSSGSGAAGSNGGTNYSATPGGNGGNGGAIYNGGTNANSMATCLLVACTISSNWAGAGGTGGTNPPNYMHYTYPPINGTNGSGGGIFNNAFVQLLNTIIADNNSGLIGPDLRGDFSSLGHNLVGRNDGASGFTDGVNSDLVGSADMPLNARLGPLTSNGGSTLTVALLHGSPALGSGDDGLVDAPWNVLTDQRGFPRKSRGHVDIGAFEYRPGNFDSKFACISCFSGGQFQLTFTNDSSPGATFTVLSSTNLDEWTAEGQATQTAPGLFQFSDSGMSNNVPRFFRVSSP